MAHLLSRFRLPLREVVKSGPAGRSRLCRLLTCLRRQKLDAVSKGSAAAEKAWRTAYSDLSGSVNTNDYGIHRKPQNLSDSHVR
jgi:hypothetical protein